MDFGSGTWNWWGGDVAHGFDQQQNKLFTSQAFAPLPVFEGQSTPGG